MENYEKLSLGTNLIIYHFKGGRFSGDTDNFFGWVRNVGHEMNIVDIVYSELYTGVYLSQDPALEEKRIQQFLGVNEIEVKHASLKISKCASELYAKHLRKNKRAFKRILPDFIIGAHAEQHSDVFVTWNPSDYDLSIPS